MMRDDHLHCLAVYGSLAPGEVNHHHLVNLVGTWQSGTVRGRLVKKGWGDGLGFPALIPDPDGDLIDVQLLTCDLLPEHWGRLDAFEGREYQRIQLPVELSDGHRVMANIYIAACDSG